MKTTYTDLARRGNKAEPPQAEHEEWEDFVDALRRKMASVLSREEYFEKMELWYGDGEFACWIHWKAIVVFEEREKTLRGEFRTLVTMDEPGQFTDKWIRAFIAKIQSGVDDDISLLGMLKDSARTL